MVWKPPEDACFALYGDNRILVRGFTESEVKEEYIKYNKRFPYFSIKILKDVTKEFLHGNEAVNNKENSTSSFE